jgi:K319L-like, PKD domain/CARDB/Fibronectin type III domain
MVFVESFCVRSLFLRVFVLLCALFIPAAGHAAEVSLAWDPNTEPDLAGYRVYYGLGSRNYDKVVEVGSSTSCVVTGLEQGRTYYFAATAVNTASVESDFSNEVSAALSTTNQAPVASAGPDQNVSEGTTVPLSGANSMDPEGGALTYSWSQVLGPNVNLVNPSAAQTTFTAPNVGPDGVALGFELTVTDSAGLKSADTCLVNVSWINQPPTANAGTDQSVNEGEIVTLNGAGSSDPDGLALNYSWTQISGTPVNLSSLSVAKPTFVAPGVGEAGESLTFQLMVTDSGGLRAWDSCIVNVEWVNQSPVASAGPDQSVNQGVSVVLDGTGSTDPDGGSLAYSWRQTGGTPVALDNTISAQPRFSAPTAASTLVFSLTVADHEGLSASDECSVVVNGSTGDDPNKNVSGVDLSGQWLSLTRTVKRSVSTYRGKFRVMNLGTQAAPSSVLYVYQSTNTSLDTENQLLGKITVSSLAAGGSVDVNVRFYAPYNDTKVYLLGIVDGANAVVETNEFNNIAVSGQR